jgi:TolB protein
MKVKRAFAWLAVALAPWTAASGDDYPLTRIPALTRLVDYEASWSPDGHSIVLISNRHGGLKVHVLNAASPALGSDMRQLTTGEAEDDSPAWSPDGRRIAFVSIRDGVSQIFIMNADGTDLRQLTRGTAENIHPTWTPDGQRLLLNTTSFAGTTAADGRNVPSPNGVIGEKIDQTMELATLRPDGSDLTRLTHGGGYTYASYSPDGRSILHRRATGALSQVWVMNADGGEDHRVSEEGYLDGWPAWSPDGKRIVFSRAVKGAFQLFVMNRDGSGVRQLTDAAGEFVNPRWSPDGSSILCGRRLGNLNLVLIPAPR